MTQLTLLVASLGKNAELATELEQVALAMGATVQVINLVDLNLPLYSTREEQEGIPNRALELTQRLSDSQGVVIVAPEYNGSLPPCLVNAISWISRSSEGDDWRRAFNGKPAVIATHSGGGGAHVLLAMRQQLSYLGMNVLGRQLQTNYGKPLNPKSAEAVLTELIKIASI